MDAWCASQTLSTPHQTLDLAQNKPASPLIGLLQERTDPHLLCAQIRDHRVRLSSPPSSTSISLPVLLARLSLLPSHHLCPCHPASGFARLHGLLSSCTLLISSSCHHSGQNSLSSGFGMMVWKGQSIPSSSAQNLPGLSLIPQYDQKV